MANAVIWALLTGLVTGGVWVAIVLFSRQRWLRQQYQAMVEETDRRLSELDDTHRRMAELEERLDFTDRLLRQPETTRAGVREGGR